MRRPLSDEDRNGSNGICVYTPRTPAWIPQRSKATRLSPFAVSRLPRALLEVSLKFTKRHAYRCIGLNTQNPQRSYFWRLKTKHFQAISATLQTVICELVSRFLYSKEWSKLFGYTVLMRLKCNVRLREYFQNYRAIRMMFMTLLRWHERQWNACNTSKSLFQARAYVLN